MKLFKDIIAAIAILCCVVSSYAQDSQYKFLHPTPQSNDLKWVKRWDANNWYAVGERATFMKTTNGGNTWILKNNIYYEPNSGYQTLNWAQFFDMNTGWACGTSGKIIKTTDGGDNWDTTGYVLQSNANWKKLRFLNTTTGFAVGNNLAFTTDGGNNWAQYLNSPGGLSDVYVQDMNNIVVVSASNSNFYYTTNGGTNWSAASMGGAGNSVCMEFVDDNTGFVCGAFGNIKMTTTGGHSWSNLVNDTIGPRDLTDLDIVNTSSGTMIYLTGRDTSLFRAPIGTSDWERVSFLGEQPVSEYDYYYSSDFSASGDTIVSVGQNGLMNAKYSSSNKVTFTNILKTGFISNVWAESTTGRVITAGSMTNSNVYDVIMYSTNGGTNWQISNYPTDGPGQIFGLNMINSMTGFVVGQQSDISKVIKTTDGGANWNLKTIPPTDDPMGEVYYLMSDFIDANTGYLYGNAGKGVKTTNGGDNWTILSPVQFEVNSGDFIDANTGWLGSTQYPYLIKTTNGGANFSPASIDTIIVRDVFFLNSNSGWVCGDDGKARRTTNGGINWSIADVPLDEDLTSIFFVDNLNGMTTGENGGIYRTRDGGNTWETNILPISMPNDVYMTATNRAFIVGDKGSVLKYEETVTGTGITFTNEVPEGYYLEQNYPNPFNPSTTIKFGLKSASLVSLKIYDITGREVATLINNERMNAGIVTKSFTADGLASGVYFYSLSVDNNLISTRKMVLVK